MKDIKTYNIKIPIHVKLVFANFCFPVCVFFGKLVIFSDREINLMTSNPEYIPTCWYYTRSPPKSFELLVQIGLWLVVNCEYCLLYCSIKKWFHTLVYNFNSASRVVSFRNPLSVCAVSWSPSSWHYTTRTIYNDNGYASLAWYTLEVN